MAKARNNLRGLSIQVNRESIVLINCFAALLECLSLIGILVVVRSMCIGDVIVFWGNKAVRHFHGKLQCSATIDDVKPKEVLWQHRRIDLDLAYCVFSLTIRIDHVGKHIVHPEERNQRQESHLVQAIRNIIDSGGLLLSCCG
jgi:hypothetical protein